MSTADQLHRLVLSVPGVAAVYPADPAWRAPMNRLGAVMAPGTSAPEPELVRLRMDGSTAHVRIRVGASGDVPAPELARRIAAEIRATLGTETEMEAGAIAVQICSIAAVPSVPRKAEPTPSPATAPTATTRPSMQS
ncbi:hypothetical protein IV498_00170 [Paenarthrobacter sp. Z7-10]|uniref:hypothetical protein n=1 Tax=Paenarthrobacter sp. Z7-10 TaxID=2787635 RepID=UPI0022A97447|nr:hypothetical protein [Paenarthrobacter sp. Z7-10]MCZ2401638.1 hypothetical protein [Paenarthrobacter sp. Z7-10]